jgi:phage baseplate assembly protein gpV
MKLAQFADGASVTPVALKSYLRADGSLTLRGEQMLAGGVRGGSFIGITAAVIRQAQAAVATGRPLSEFAQANNVSMNNLRNFVRVDGSLSVYGMQMLASGTQRSRLKGTNAETIRQAQAAIAAGQSLEAFAQENNVSLIGLRTYLHADGSLAMMGRAQLLGKQDQPVTMEVVRNALSAVAAGQSLEAFANAQNVSLASLRHSVRIDGTLTLEGAQLLAGNVHGGQIRRATAEIVRQAQVAIVAGQSLSAFAEMNNVSLNSLRKFVTIDGSLTVLGTQLLAGGVRGGQIKGITPEIVRQAQADISAGQSVNAFAQANDVSLAGLRSVIRADGSLTPKGRQLLDRLQRES